MDKFQPVEGIGSDVASIEINLEQKVQKLSKKAENGFLAITLSPDCEMSSYLVTSPLWGFLDLKSELIRKGETQN